MSVGRTILFLLPIGLCVAFLTRPSQQTAQETAPGQSAAQTLVKITKAMFPKTYSDGSYVGPLKAEGDAVIFQIRPSPEFADEYSSSEWETFHINAMCEGGKKFESYFRDGGKLRINIEGSDGKIHKGKIRSSC